MRARKSSPDTRTTAPVVPPARPRKKARGPRVRLTHFEIRRGETLRLRIAVADDALAEAGDELGALIKRIAPNTRTTTVQPVQTVVQPVGEPEFVVSRAHSEHDAAYHANLRDHLTELFSSLCDTALEDALDVARNERERRAEGGN
jgi:hypothetical protein